VNFEASKGRMNFGKTLSFTGSLSAANSPDTPGSCLNNVTVIIRRDVVGGAEQFVDVGRTQTDSQGQFSFNYKADCSATWVATVEKNNPPDCAEDSSEPEVVLVRTLIKLRIPNDTPRRGSKFEMFVHLRPCEASHVGTKIAVRRVFQGRNVRVGGGRLNAECVRRVVKRADFKRAVFDATWFRQDDDHIRSVSRPKLVETRRRR